jgi:hypothetical chaperone protein
MPYHLGLDFGTTNSALAAADTSGRVSVVRFPVRGEDLDTFRSILFFDGQEPELPPVVEAGPLAIERYLESEAHGRLIQSIKTFLASESFTETRICGRPYTLEDLVALIVAPMRAAAEKQFGVLDRRLTVGRPVHFAGQHRLETDTIAEERLRRALAKVGFDDVHFVLEPVAAAYHYESHLARDELVLVADFGGGTSDFSILRLGPSYHHRRTGQRELLAVDGVGIAGDLFDARTLHHVVSPELGLGSAYRSADKVLPVPLWLYSHLERWHFLSMLKSPKNLRLLDKLHYQALEPRKIAAFTHIVVNDLGFHLYRAVSDAKVALSNRQEAPLCFAHPPVFIQRTVSRPDFEEWIRPDVERIAACVDRCLGSAAVGADRIERVFMTGGSSFVPAIRRIFEARFGADRLRYGDEFVSVARGLALRARDVFSDKRA